MSFFGVLGTLGQLLPGYIQGRQNAIRDNWQDMANFDTTLHNQLKNWYDITTWENQINNSALQSAMLGQNALMSGMNLSLNQANYPGQLGAAQVNSQYAPLLALSNLLNQLRMNQQMPQLWQNLLKP